MKNCIEQKVVFKNTNVKDLYHIYMDDKKHQAAIHPKASECLLEDLSFKERHGKIIHSIENSLIIQLWRADGPWSQDDMDSILVIKFEQEQDNAIIELHQLHVPEAAQQFVNSDSWSFLYWNPIKEYLANDQNF